MLFRNRLFGAITAMLVIASLVLTMTGCPKADKTLRQFHEKSAELAVYGGKLTTSFGDAYKAGEISREQLADLNVATGAFTKGLGIYREAVKAAEDAVKANDGQPLPRDALSKLDLLLNEQVVAAFTNIVQKVGLLSLNQSETVKQVINGIRLVLVAIKALIADTRLTLDAAGVSNG